MCGSNSAHLFFLAANSGLACGRLYAALQSKQLQTQKPNRQYANPLIGIFIIEASWQE